MNESSALTTRPRLLAPKKKNSLAQLKKIILLGLSTQTWRRSYSNKKFFFLRTEKNLLKQTC
jgi:hypothetical protein